MSQLVFDYCEDLTVIRENETIICKKCTLPLTYPIYCNDCFRFFCRYCDATDTAFIHDCIMLQKNPPSLDGGGFIEDQLKKLLVNCHVNKKYGCKWTGTRTDYLMHKCMCEKIYTPCVFGCDQKVSSYDTHQCHLS